VKPLRCLIVDDERLARNNLRRRIESLPGVTITGEADSVATARIAVAEHRPDLLLLDIQMPDGTGFDVLRGLDDPPAVIFVTAFDHFALRAFEINAVDYLLKPVQNDRLREAIERAIARSESGAPVSSDALPPFRDDDLALLEIGSSGTFVPVRDILAVQADQKYTRVLLPDGWGPIARQSLDEWERRLPADWFLRLDRKLIVNLREMNGVHFVGRSVELAVGPQKVPFSAGRAAAAKLDAALKSRP
jgi:two-component system, LytTR family, response regulator